MLGYTPTVPEVAYGWIEGGDPSPIINRKVGVHGVQRFWEKPSLDLASELHKRDCVWWNAFVMVAQVTTLLELFMSALLQLYKGFVDATSSSGVKLERQAVENLYPTLPSINFSDDVIARNAANLAVLSLGDLEWSDLGGPKPGSGLARKKGNSSRPGSVTTVEPPARMRAVSF